MRVLILSFVLVGTLSFAYTVNAEEACLRGGDGNCVELVEINGDDNPRFLLGGSNADSVFRLKDNTFVATVAREVETSGTPRGLTTPILVRYEIDLYVSHDLGLTWSLTEVENKGKWYVDEIRSGSEACAYWNCEPGLFEPAETGTESEAGYAGAAEGAGFLGYSVTHYEGEEESYIGIAHTQACNTARDNGSLIEFNDPWGNISTYGCETPSSSGSWALVDGTTFFDFVVYDYEEKVFKQPIIGSQSDPENTPTRSLTQTHTRRPSATQICEIGPCYGTMKGTSHPSVTIGGVAEDTAYALVSYYSYRGDVCSRSGNGACTDQNNLNDVTDNHARSELWTRWFQIDVKTGAITSSDAENIQVEEYTIDLGVEYDEINHLYDNGLDDRHAIFSSVESTWSSTASGSFSPILFYGYSKPNTTEWNSTNNISKMRWAYWNGSTWVKPDGSGVDNPDNNFVQDITDIWKNNQTIDGELLVAFDSSNGAVAGSGPIDIVSAFSSVSAPKSSYYNPYQYGHTHGSRSVVHVAAIADVEDIGTGVMSATPTYIRFYSPSAGAWNLPQGLILADQLSSVFTNGGAIAVDAETVGNPEIRPFFYNGGPSIQWNAQNVYVALPGAPVNDFKARNVDIYATRISVVNWNSDVSLSWLDNQDKDDGISNIPVYSQITAANRQVDAAASSERAFASPHLLDYGLQIVTAEDSSTLTNLNFPNMLFTRADFGDLESAKCAIGQPCLINFSGEQNLHAITGWAWADVVGWLSLSCRNLNSCAKKSAPWSSLEGGNHYGLRSVVNYDLPRNPIIGKVWSERVGFVSFSRQDSVSTINLCGNPPGVGPGDDYYIDPNTCGYVLNSDFGEIDSVHDFYVENNATFPTSGYFVVDAEVFFYGVGSVSDCGLGGHCIRIGGIVRGRDRLDIISGQEFQNIARDHAEGAPIFFLGTDDPTAKTTVADMYVGINHRDNTNFEVEGWARALAWKDYQVTYCGGVIGPSEPSPCDKEWGWIKLEGDWETIKRGTFDATQSCGVALNNIAYLNSVEGYPDPVETGNTEYIEIAPMGTGFPPNNFPGIFTYTGIDFINNALTGVQDISGRTEPFADLFPFLCSGNDGLSVPWVARLANGIADTATDIPIDSFSGFLPSGKAMIFWDENLDGTINASEIIEYSQINTNVSPALLSFATRGVDGTSATTFNNPTETFIRPIAEVGKYNTFAIDVASYTPQKTLLGFGWSSPTTDSLTPDPFESRYRNSLAGFGWINFQPNRLEQIHPFLRTLFSNVYVGGNYELIGPNTSDSNEYTSTYLLQGKGFALPFLSGNDVSSRAYQDCLFNPPPQPDPVPIPELTTEQLCSGLAPVSEAPTIELESGGLTIFGRLPSHDDIATWVRGCRDKDGTLINGTGECPAAADQLRKFSSVQSLTSFNNQAISDGNGAVSGINRFGHTVILCRATPSTNIGQYYQQSESKNIFTDIGWEGNPEECRWQESIGWDGSLSVDYDPAVGAPDDTKLCVKQTSGTLNSSGTITISDGANTENIGYVIAVVNTCPNLAPVAEPETELKLTAPLTTSFASGVAVNEISTRPFYKVRHSPLGLPTVYIVPDDYGEKGEDYMMLEFSSMPIQFNNGDKTFDWDTNDDGFLDDSLPDYNGNGEADEFEHGAITFSVPGTLFFLDAQMRYCPTGIPGLPCESGEDTEQDVSDIRQLASVGWLVDGTVGNLGGFASGYYSGAKSYLMGAFLIYGEESADRYCATGVPGPCDSTFAGLGRYGDFISHWQLAQGIQLNVYGLVIARHFSLTGKYFVQNEKEAVIEPSENFVYDGRVIANPPPGFEDVSSGLPAISQATP